MTASSRVRFGLRRMFFSVPTDGKYEVPWQNPGAESVAISNGSSSSSSIAADDNPNFYVSSGAGGKEMTVQASRFVRDFYTKILGQAKDTATGALVEGPTDAARNFAFGFETTGDQGGYRVWALNNSATVPTFTAGTNTSSGVTEDSESSTFSTSAIKCSDGVERTMVTFEPGDTGYEKAFETVPFMDMAPGA
ncbi:MAG: hypothetical protein MR874_03480 [Coriobacteriaceae bacterium]|nr:hypothetical protein [Coriobacteriaceae bacterium]